MVVLDRVRCSVGEVGEVGEVVRGEHTPWNGDQLFFALTVWDGVQEVLHGGSAYELGGNCFKLDLD